MATTATLTGSSNPPDERLAAWHLSTEIIHNALRSGFARSRERSTLAPAATPAMDVYGNGFEDLAKILTSQGWTYKSVKNQPRLSHPHGLVTLSITSASGVGSEAAMPITNSKGPTTRQALAHSDEGTLFTLDTPGHESAEPPLYFIVYEPEGDILHLEISRPSDMDTSNHIVRWTDRIILPPLTLDSTPFDNTTQTGQIFDVPVEQIV